jgi:hypothetical protein
MAKKIQAPWRDQLVVSARVPIEIAEQLAERAEENGVTRSDEVSAALYAYLGRSQPAPNTEGGQE